jgi:carbon monoxide dehydrogenase subunit G
VKLTNEMVVPASVEEAWAVMLDVERVAPCLPGASIDSAEGDEYRGTMKVKLGPITSSFQGTLRIEEADESARRAVLSARAREGRGQGTAAATITSTMEPAEDGTRVKVETDLRVTGPAASFGRGVMQDVSARLMREFAECLAAEMGRTPAATGGGVARAEAESRPAEVALTGALPDDVPEPPPTEAGVRWPAGTQPPPPKPADDVLDLGAASREALVRRAAPVAATALGLLLVAAVLRRRRNR